MVKKCVRQQVKSSQTEKGVIGKEEDRVSILFVNLLKNVQQ